MPLGEADIDVPSAELLQCDRQSLRVRNAIRRAFFDGLCHRRYDRLGERGIEGWFR
jgi:hypothetical protein